ncbi:MAG: OmpA family protein [Lentisphaerae bacterium]|nr:OmpA family protein [Lentisphaerota bacterium]
MKTLNLILLATVASVVASAPVSAQEKSDIGKWYVSPGIGVLIFEGNEPANAGSIGLLRLGYEATDHLTFEFGGLYGPRFSKSSQSKYGPETFKPAEAWGVSADVLYHFNRWERWDPYVSVGAGYMRSPDRIFADHSVDAWMPRVGGGVIWHWTDSVSLRANATLAAGIHSKVEAVPMFDLGMIYRFGGQPAAAPTGTGAVVGETDTDGDGLTDAEEARLGTNPRMKDTDGDGLTDGEEVNVYKTDPLNRDTDFDLLSDGDEVLKYKTDPLKPDTDAGGVWDGHEVLEDSTDPLNKNDDLMLFAVQVEFGYDETVIRDPKYFAQFDVIAKVLTRHPEATAVIEGHADRKAKSSPQYNQNLSELRAKAVQKHLTEKGIQASRLKAVGFGFTRPKVQPDLVNGNPENRRVEIYIRGAGGLAAKEAFLKEEASTK